MIDMGDVNTRIYIIFPAILKDVKEFNIPVALHCFMLRETQVDIYRN